MSTSGPAVPHSDSRIGAASASRQRHLGEPAVGQAAQVVLDRGSRVAPLDVEAHGGFRVPALGQLAAAAALLLHQQRDVRVLDPRETEGVEQLQVQRHRGDPLLAADDQVDAHQVIVHGVREVVGGQPRFGVAALQDHRVVAVVVEGQLAADRVGEAHPGARGSRRAEADHVGLARRQPLGDLLRIGVAPDRPLAVVTGQGACRPLPRGDLLQVLLGREARVGAALAQQFADVGQVDLRPRGLGVGPVVAGLVVLVRADGEVRERLGELGRGALGDAGLVGVLQADQVDAAGLPGDIHVDRRRVHAADVQVARRARREARDFRFFGQVTGRVALLPVIRLGQVRREQGIDDILAEHERAAPNDVRSRPQSSVPPPLASRVPAASRTARPD